MPVCNNICCACGLVRAIWNSNFVKISLGYAAYVGDSLDSFRSESFRGIGILFGELLMYLHRIVDLYYSFHYLKCPFKNKEKNHFMFY